jgi:hypothetical protein
MGVSLRRILETEWGVELCSGSTVEGGGGGWEERSLGLGREGKFNDM